MGKYKGAAQDVAGQGGQAGQGEGVDGEGAMG